MVTKIFDQQLTAQYLPQNAIVRFHWKYAEWFQYFPD